MAPNFARHVFEVCTKRFGVPLSKLTNNMLFGKVRFLEVSMHFSHLIHGAGIARSYNLLPKEYLSLRAPRFGPDGIATQGDGANGWRCM